MFNQDLHLARLTVDDLSRLAASWRRRAEAGEPAAGAIAMAMESVVIRRRAARLVRLRSQTARRALAPLHRAAEWAVSHW